MLNRILLLIIFICLCLLTYYWFNNHKNYEYVINDEKLKIEYKNAMDSLSKNLENLKHKNDSLLLNLNNVKNIKQTLKQKFKQLDKPYIDSIVIIDSMQIFNHIKHEILYNN